MSDALESGADDHLPVSVIIWREKINKSENDKFILTPVHIWGEYTFQYVTSRDFPSLCQREQTFRNRPANICLLFVIWEWNIVDSQEHKEDTKPNTKAPIHLIPMEIKPAVICQVKGSKQSSLMSPLDLECLAYFLSAIWESGKVHNGNVMASRPTISYFS